MKIRILALLLFSLAWGAQGQSDSYFALKDAFRGHKDVYSFSVGGWACRWLLTVAGEYEFNHAIEEVKQVRLMVIPKNEFDRHQVSVNGFRKVLSEDRFEELACIRERNEVVTIYIKENGNRLNYYFVLVEEADEVVAMEIKGYINPGQLKAHLVAHRDN
jgi:hypothetical protein